MYDSVLAMSRVVFKTSFLWEIDLAIFDRTGKILKDWQNFKGLAELANPTIYFFPVAKVLY